MEKSKDVSEMTYSVTWDVNPYSSDCITTLQDVQCTLHRYI